MKLWSWAFLLIDESNVEMEVGRKFNTIEIEHEIMIGLLGLLADESKMVVPEKSDMEAIYIFLLPIFFSINLSAKP